MARAASAAPGAAPLAAVAISGLVLPVGTGGWYRYDTGSDGEDFSWGLSEGDGDVWLNDGGSNGRHLSRHSGGPRFWFRDHDDEFVVRDPALVAEARAATRPLREVSQEMGALGREMGRRGARMGRIGGRLGALGARIAQIELRLARSGVADGQRSDMDARLRELRAETKELRAQVEREQFAHDDEQRAQSRRMSELSARHHQVLQEVREKVRAIAARARREGKAERPHANA